MFLNWVILQMWKPSLLQVNVSRNQRGLARPQLAAPERLCLYVHAQQQSDSLFGNPRLALLSKGSNWTNMTSIMSFKIKYIKVFPQRMILLWRQIASFPFGFSLQCIKSWGIPLQPKDTHQPPLLESNSGKCVLCQVCGTIYFYNSGRITRHNIPAEDYFQGLLHFTKYLILLPIFPVTVLVSG